MVTKHGRINDHPELQQRGRGIIRKVMQREVTELNTITELKTILEDSIADQTDETEERINGHVQC